MCVATLVLFADGSAIAAADPSCSTKLKVVPCPDLVPGPLTAKVIEDGRRLQLTGRVDNNGTADAQGTTLQVKIGNEELDPEPLAAVPVKASVPVDLKEPIPADLRGTGQPVTLTVDPRNDVPELEELNNVARTKASLPPLPDLVVDSATLAVSKDGDAVVVAAVVANRGGEDDAVPTTLLVGANGVTRSATVPALAKETSSPLVEVTLPVLAPERVGPVTVTVTVDQPDVLAEENETNNDFTPDPVTIAPDLTVTAVEKALDGSSLSLDVTVENRGNTSAPETWVRASAHGWNPAKRQLAALAAGAAKHVKLSLTVPEDAAGQTVKVVVAVDPVRGEPQENNTRGVRVDVPGHAAVPDLSVGSVQRLLRDSSLRLKVTVANVGGADAAATRVHVSAPGWDAVAARLTPVAVEGSTVVPLTLAVPRSAQGQSVELTVSVDPVEGEPTGNNTRTTQVDVPKTIVRRPDLSLSRLRLRSDGSTLRARALVANVGDVGARDIRLELAAAGWPRRVRVLRALAAGAASLVSFIVPVSSDHRGTTSSFRLRAQPVPRERNLANNEVSAKVTLLPPPLPSHSRLWLVLLAAVAGSLAALTLGAGFALRARRLRVRLRRQEEADAERPETCEVPQTHVLRGECKLKPALRKIEKLELAVREGEDEERRKSLEGAIVKKLNRALWAHRLRRRRRVRALVAPLGEQLAAEIERWLGDNERAEVGISAEISGGKLECEFKRSECVRDGDACHWQEREQWTGEVEHTVKEPVAAVHVPLEPRADRVRQLSANLVGLVGRVDVPRRVRAPAAVPLPRD